MSCPLKTPEYLELEKEFGEGKALGLWKINKEKSPTIEEGKKLLDSRVLNMMHHHETGLDEQNKRSPQLGEPLSQEGRDEARIDAEKPEIKNLKTLYISDAPRAKETAEIYKESNPDLNIIVDSNLRCWDAGKFTGKPEKDFPQKFYIKNADIKVPEGESYQQYMDRFLPAIQHYHSSGDQVGILSHNDGLKLLNHLSKNFGEFDAKKYFEDNKNFESKSIQTIRHFNQGQSNKYQPDLFNEPIKHPEVGSGLEHFDKTVDDLKSKKTPLEEPIDLQKQEPEKTSTEMFSENTHENAQKMLEYLKTNAKIEELCRL